MRVGFFGTVPNHAVTCHISRSRSPVHGSGVRVERILKREGASSEALDEVLVKASSTYSCKRFLTFRNAVLTDFILRMPIVLPFAFY